VGAEAPARIGVGEPSNLPALVQPLVPGIGIESWIRAHHAWVEEQFSKYRALLFRGFAPTDPSAFRTVIDATSRQVLRYQDGSSPRTAVGQGIYTSTEYPAGEIIPLHNELSYAHVWPARVYFFCVRPADSGGRTPLADCRKVLERIPQPVRSTFESRRVLYLRNFTNTLGRSWQHAFETEDPAQVETFCQTHGIGFEWLPDNGLRTRQIRAPVLSHHRTGEPVWFNHAAFFHLSSLPAEVRAELGRTGTAPFQVSYGDGSPIPDDVIQIIRDAYAAETRRFDWQTGDLLMLDNQAIAHGRDPFTGRRGLLAALADPCSQPKLDPAS
jgi:alpha-ketoglutarate-dependent taurine dioxygenase